MFTTRPVVLPLSLSLSLSALGTSSQGGQQGIQTHVRQDRVKEQLGLRHPCPAMPAGRKEPSSDVGRWGKADQSLLLSPWRGARGKARCQRIPVDTAWQYGRLEAPWHEGIAFARLCFSSFGSLSFAPVGTGTRRGRWPDLHPPRVPEATPW